MYKMEKLVKIVVNCVLSVSESGSMEWNENNFKLYDCLEFWLLKMKSLLI